MTPVLLPRIISLLAPLSIVAVGLTALGRHRDRRALRGRIAAAVSAA
jgi:hypothetical protein